MVAPLLHDYSYAKLRTPSSRLFPVAPCKYPRAGFQIVGEGRGGCPGFAEGHPGSGWGEAEKGRQEG